MFALAEKGSQRPKMLTTVELPVPGNPPIIPAEMTELTDKPLNVAPLPFPPKPSPLAPVFEDAIKSIEKAIGYGAECERNLESARARAAKLEKELGEASDKVKQSQPTLDRVSMSLYRREAEVEKLAAENTALKKQCDGMAEKLANRMGGGDPFNEADTPLLRAAMALVVTVDPHIQDRHRKAYLRRRGWKMDEQGWTDPVKETAGIRMVDAVDLQSKRDAEGHRQALEQLVTGMDSL